MTTRNASLLPVETPPQRRLRLVVRRRQQEDDKESGPFARALERLREEKAQQVSPPAPGAPVNRALFQAGFPLGVAQRVAEPKPPPTLQERARAVEPSWLTVGRTVGGPLLKGAGIALAPIQKATEAGMAGLQEQALAETGGQLAIAGFTSPMARKVSQEVAERPRDWPSIQQRYMDNPAAFRFVMETAVWAAVPQTAALRAPLLQLRAAKDTPTMVRIVAGAVEKGLLPFDLVEQAIGKVAGAGVQAIRRAAPVVGQAGREAFLAPAKGLLTGAVGEGAGAAKAGRATAKEPWQMTVEDIAKMSELNAMRIQRSHETWELPQALFAKGKWGIGTAEARRQSHRIDVRRALSEGKPVPSEVLADYPDLAPGAKSAAAKAEGPVTPVGGPSVAAVPAGQARAPQAKPPRVVRRAAPKPAEATRIMDFSPASAIAPEVGKQTIDPALLRRLQETLQPPPQTEADVSAFIARRRARMAAPAAAPLAAQPAPGAILERGAGAVPPPAPAPPPLAAGQGLSPAPAAPVAAAGAPPPVKPPVSEAAPITAQPERGFITHTAESPMGSPILRKLYDEEPIVYSPITNKETLQKASEAVNADPIGARARLMVDAPINPETMVDDLAQGFVLMRKAANEGNVTELRDLSKRIAERYTPVAQALQVASTIDKLSPEGLFVYTQRLIEQAVAKGKGPAVATRLRLAARRAEVKEATANAAADMASAEEKVVQARKNVSTTTETATRSGTLKGNQRARDFQYLIDDTVREVRAKLTPAERQAIIKAKAILKQSVAEMDEATANSFLDRAAELKDLDGEARVQALMDLVDEVRQLPQVQAGIVAGKTLKPSAKLLKQQAADLAQLVDRTARNVFQQLNSVDRLAVARVKAILRRTDVELPQGMAEELLQEAHSLRGLPLAERASALNRLTQKIKSFDPVAKELARKKVVADAEARARQAARQAANDLATLIDASSRKVVKHVTAADRMAISQAKTVLRRFGAELPTEMAEDFLTRARALNNLPDAEQAAGVKALVNGIKDFSPVKQAREELALARSRAAAAKQSARDLQYLANEEARVSKARLRNVERETIRSAKARLKDAGVEMPEELAQSFLDRAKALRGITDEYDQMRAAQSLLADVHNLVPGSKINAFFDIIGLPRIFQAAYDLSFSLRQGIVHAWAYPRQWAGMFKTGLKSFASEDAALAADRQFFKRPLYKPGQEAGLEYIDRWGSIGQQEETFINNWTERVPGIRQSNRAYIAQGNKLRADAFDAKVMDWLPPDVREEVYWGRKSFETLDELVAATGKSRKDFERLAQWQNVLTGRGDLGNFLRSNNQWLNALFYAPRFAVSRFEVPIFAARNIVANPALRKMVAKDLAASIVGSTATLYMLSKLPGVEVEWSPLSSDWRKAKFGPLRIDMDGGFNVLIRQVVQLSLGERKSTTTGKTDDVNRTKILANYLTSKFSPTASFIRDVLDQETAFGEPLDTPEAWGKRLAEAWTPFVGQDVYEATQELGAPGLGVAPLSAFGAGVNVYGPRVTPRRRPSPLRSRRSRLTIRPTPTQGAPSGLRSPVGAGR